MCRLVVSLRQGDHARRGGVESLPGGGDQFLRLLYSGRVTAFRGFLQSLLGGRQFISGGLLPFLGIRQVTQRRLVGGKVTGDIPEHVPVDAARAPVLQLRDQFADHLFVLGGCVFILIGDGIFPQLFQRGTQLLFKQPAEVAEKAVPVDIRLQAGNLGGGSLFLLLATET